VDLCDFRYIWSTKDDIPNGVRLVDLRASRVFRSIPPLVRYPRQWHPDVIISAKDYQNIVTIWAVKLALIKTKIIVTTHIDVSIDWKDRKDIKSSVLPYLVRIFYHWAEHVVTVSAGAKSSLVYLARIPPRKVKVIYNPVINSAVLFKAEELLEHPWFALGDPPVILGVGRLVRQKDFANTNTCFCTRAQRATCAADNHRGGRREMPAGDPSERA